jgi:CHRD domain
MTLNMRKLLICALTLLLPCMMVGATKDKLELHANLVGIQEVVAGTIVTNAAGTFTATINDDSSLTYTLTYKDLSSSVLQAHIHVGASKVAGNITIFLCSNLSNGPADTPACPDDSTHSGTVTRTISAADVTDLAAAQGIPAGDFKDVVRAIVSHVTYANVHSTNFPNGEIRGQIHSTPDPGDELPGADDHHCED